MVLGKLDKSMKLDHTFTPRIKVNSKWLKDLNIRHDTIQFLEENTGKSFWRKLCKYFIRSDSQGNRDTNKNKQIIKFTSFCTAKETIKKKERKKTQPTEWEKIFANNATDKALTSKIYKQLIQFKNKNINNPIEKRQKT